MGLKQLLLFFEIRQSSAQGAAVTSFFDSANNAGYLRLMESNCCRSAANFCARSAFVRFISS
jgi:hypothetical protein